jgi:predicted nuclease of predicted toxin-antitoxin system
VARSQGKACGGLKFIIDECLSPGYVEDLRQQGFVDVVHIRFVGLQGVRDDSIVKYAFANDRIIITGNTRDFRRLLGAMTLHPGAVTVEPIDKLRTWRQIASALSFIEAQSHPADYMVNRYVEVTTAGGVRPYLLPE